MLVDGFIGGGSSDGTSGADIAGISAQVAAAERIGYDGVWATEVGRDPFLPLLLAADRSPRLQIGTAIAVAFARNPMTMASTANDLQTFSSGRFVLGLGSQIKPHIQRRFSMPWSAPTERMREFVLAMRAIWRSWHHGEPLDFRGDIYQHTLMTPLFNPGPNPYGPPPVLIAAVGTKMASVAAEVADGILVHSFTTERYLREVTLPIVESVLRDNGRRREQFTLSYPGLVATGIDEKSYDEAVRTVRERVAFYGATPAYRGVLELHGWGDLHTELHRLSRQNEWDVMTKIVDDTVLHTFAVVGEPAAVVTELRRRFDDLINRFTLFVPYPLADEARQIIVTGLQRH
ncbi:MULTISPECIES: TIGR03617 family F420-dependent LLM class oxidoreductase [Protofrankia]|uniref:Putative F420-dependent oxidoreductase n=1 Tax=Candidatus Protofrankia datiscae TaxID=2716812 RepID=F8AY58_9ACTN|nr:MULTISPECIES: TIGR03617 family F420-dependent LLM class oxidoreductase [Protofrankia]AEH09488.1 putative F420-dependent oxidoreductase [Candidatus Protofrankia datiscae]